MNKMIRTLLTLAAFGAGSTALLAQPAVKLVTVDIAKTYDSYYKAEDAMAKFNDARQKAQEQAEEMRKQGQIMVEEYKTLLEQVQNNSLLTAEAKAKSEDSAKKKLEEIQRKQQDMQNFLQTTDRQLQQQMLTRRELLVEEIVAVVKEISKRKGGTLVIDKSGPSAFRIPVVLDVDPAFDITEEVIAQINKDRPAAAPAAAVPAGTTPVRVAPATTPAPATGGFSVPNVNKPAEPAKKP